MGMNIRVANRLGFHMGSRGTSSAAAPSTLSAPTLILTTANLTYPPTFDIALDPTYSVGDTLVARRRNLAGAITWTSAPHVITLGEATDTSAGTSGKATLDFSSFTSGTNRFEVYGQKPGEGVGPTSNVVIQGPDDVAPTLSLPVKSGLGATFATIGITTNEGNGTLYWVVTTSATQPTAAQLRLGQNSAGVSAGAGRFGNQAVSATGAQSASVSGTTLSTLYYVWWLHDDAALNASTIAADSYTSLAVDPVLMRLDPAAKNPSITLSNGNLTATGAAQSAMMIARSTIVMPAGGKYYAELTYNTRDASNAAGIGIGIGVCNSAASLTNYDPPGRYAATGGGLATNGYIMPSQTLVSATYAAGGVDMIAVSVPANLANPGTVWIGSNGTWLNGNPSAGTGGEAITIAQWYLYVACNNVDTMTLNPGNTAHTYTKPTGFAVMP